MLSSTAGPRSCSPVPAGSRRPRSRATWGVMPKPSVMRSPRSTPGGSLRCGGSRRGPSVPRRLRRRPRGTAPRPVAPEPPQLWETDQSVDLGVGGRRELRTGADRGAGQRGDDSGHPGALGDPLAAGQALDHQSGSGVCAEKSARHRLIRLAATHPTGALGFEDEVWWSRLAQPAVHRWAAPDQRLRLVEQVIAKDDPDPKALACYGLLVRGTAPDDGRPEAVWLRFVAGRPVSARTIEFLAGCCTKLAAAGKEALLLVWDNAPWHGSRAVRQWLRAHNRQVKPRGPGVRILPCYRPIKSPWLNPIEPQGATGKRRVVDPARLLTAAELRARVCAAFNCPEEDLLGLPVPLDAHLVIPEEVA